MPQIGLFSMLDKSEFFFFFFYRRRSFENDLQAKAKLFISKRNLNVDAETQSKYKNEAGETESGLTSPHHGHFFLQLNVG